MSAKEIIIKQLQKIGYDTITACSLADKAVKEMKTYPSGTHAIFLNKVVRITFTIP